MCSREPSPNSKHWENLLTENDVIVVTKDSFFRTVNFLFQFAHTPERCTWEFFVYRPWQYIFGIWCATFDIEGFALSCGAQHPFIHYEIIQNLKKILKYVLPDYVLMDHTLGAEGEQENRVLLIIEVKALGRVDADTEDGRRAAASRFTSAWKQRLNQARLAFQTHPNQQEVHIMMVSGPWWDVYIYERSKVLDDSQPPHGKAPSRRDSPPQKRWRRGDEYPFRIQSTANSPPNATQAAAVHQGSSEPHADDIPQVGNKRKREGFEDVSLAPVNIHHVLQLRSDGQPNALNPWLLRFLGRIKESVERATGGFRTQNSWFDWSTDNTPVGDGHAEGFILPSKGDPAATDDAASDIDAIRRLDEDPLVVAPVPSTPGNMHSTLTPIQMQLNALLSPKLQTPRIFRGDVFSDHSLVLREPTDGMSSNQPPKRHSAHSDLNTDDNATPKAQPDSRRQGRELSPSAAYLERRQRGPVNPPLFYPAPPDSSPPRFTPPRLSWPRTDDERDSDSSTGCRAGTPDPEAIPRPASAPPAPSSPPSRASHNTTAAHSVSRGHQSRPKNRSRQERALCLIPPSRAQPSRTHQPPRAFNKGALVRPLTETMSDRQPTNVARKTATEREWQRRPPTKDELLLHALKATRGTDGNWDLMQAYRNAGMNQKQAARACEQQNKTLPSKQPGESRPGGPSVASGSRSLSTTATYTVPLAPTRRPATHTSDRGKGPSQRPPSGVATGPSTTHAAARASSSRPPPMDGASVARTAGLNQGHSQSSNDDFPNDVPGTSRPTSAPLTSPSPRPSVTPQDFKAGSSREHHPGGRPHRSHGSIQPGPRDRSLDDLEATREAQVNRLTERIGNLGVTNVPDNAGDPKWDNPSLESLYVLGEMARKGGREVREVFRSVGMDERQVEDAHERYRLHVRDQWTDMDLLRALVTSSDGTANTRPDATPAGHPREGPRRATTRSEVRSPRPSNPSRDRGEPPIPQATPGFALPSTNLDRGPMSTNTGRKGKEKQG